MRDTSTRRPVAGGCSFSIPRRVARLPRCTGHMDDDETMTEAQIDAEFERTQPIGNAINALAQAEGIIAAVDEMPSGVQAHLDWVLRDLLGPHED